MTPCLYGVRAGTWVKLNRTLRVLCFVTSTEAVWRVVAPASPPGDGAGSDSVRGRPGDRDLAPGAPGWDLHQRQNSSRKVCQQGDHGAGTSNPQRWTPERLCSCVCVFTVCAFECVCRFVCAGLCSKRSFPNAWKKCWTLVLELRGYCLMTMLWSAFLFSSETVWPQWISEACQRERLRRLIWLQVTLSCFIWQRTLHMCQSNSTCNQS